jgi:hypothetical protein
MQDGHRDETPVSPIRELVERTGALLGRLDAAREGRNTVAPPHAVLIAGSHAMAAVVRAGVAIRQHVGDEDLALLNTLLARLGTRLHTAESLDIPQGELLTLADEIRQLAVEVERSVGGPPEAHPPAGT